MRTTAPLTAATVGREADTLLFGVIRSRFRATGESVSIQMLWDGVFKSVVVETFSDEAKLEEALRELEEKLAGATETSSEVVADRAILERTMEAPHVEVDEEEVPKITGNLVRDVRNRTGLTNEQLADIFDVKERTILNVQSGKVPLDKYEPYLNSLLAIASILVGGLGPDGVRQWLTLGQPSRLDRIRRGEIKEIHDEARAYLR